MIERGQNERRRSGVCVIENDRASLMNHERSSRFLLQVARFGGLGAVRGIILLFVWCIRTYVFEGGGRGEEGKGKDRTGGEGTTKKSYREGERKGGRNSQVESGRPPLAV